MINLRRLDLSDNNIHDEAAQILFSDFGIKNLHVLILKNNKIRIPFKENEEGNKKINNNFALHELRELDLRLNNLIDKAF